MSMLSTDSKTYIPRSKKRFIGRQNELLSKKQTNITVARQIPQEIFEDSHLNDAIKQLPSNYSFEIHKTIHHIRKHQASMVALQMPEGLQMFACAIADIIEQFTEALTVIMGDVTYGACCIDDYTAMALGCDMLIHYGHSCLVPIDQTKIRTLYVFVEIAIDFEHLAQSVRMNFPASRGEFRRKVLQNYSDKDKHLDNVTHKEIALEDAPQKDSNLTSPTRLALVSTVQFVAPLQQLKEDLCHENLKAHTQVLLTKSGEISNEDTHQLQPSSSGIYEAVIPRSKPLSPGEVLGCTAPRLSNVDALLYVGDGRFHLEAIMIANPNVPAFRYDPYSKKLTREYYDFREMLDSRQQAVTTARSSLNNLRKGPLVDSTDASQAVWGIVLGTLGRQGSYRLLQAILRQLTLHNISIPYVPILLSELSPAKIGLFSHHISTFIQTSCPRLSIDWGYAFPKPLLSPYEVSVALGKNSSWMEGEKRTDSYPMDFYTVGSPWANARVRGGMSDLSYSS